MRKRSISARSRAVVEALSTVAEPRGQVRLEGTRSEDMGRGLGLTFCRLAVQAHGGSIRADASASGGSSFRLRLPRQPVTR